MSGRLTNMKHTVLIVVAALSLILAYPVTHNPQHSKTTEATHVVSVKPIKKVAKTVSAVAVVTPAPVALPAIQLPDIACAQYASLFEQYNWDVHTAVAICEAESTGVPTAIGCGCNNSDGLPDYGLMQLHNIDILDPAQNISYAYYHKYLTQGWGAWSTYNSGKYLQFL